MAKKIQSITDLIPDAANANKGTERGRYAVESSLRETGAGRSIVVDKDGRIIAGNKTLEAWADISGEIEIVKTDGKKLIVVQREDLDLSDVEGLARKLAYYDNRAGQLGLEWDAEQLFSDLNAGVDLSGMFFDDEIADILATIDGYEKETTGEDPGADVSKADELQAVWNVQLGDLWQLGDHRLICGDCTDEATVQRVLQNDRPVLMVTDPPYGVDYDPEWRNEAAKKGLISYAARSIGKVQNDDRVDWSDAYGLSGAQVAYVWHADRHASEVQRSLEDSGYQIICQIIWAKPVFAISRGDYHWQHEPCWYCVKRGATHNWQGSRSESTLWQIERGIPEKTGHGTEKPVECMARPIRNNTSAGDVVYDPFCGSGTTGVACQQLGRKCRMVEIYPQYCAVILERFEKMGITPVLIERTTGNNVGGLVAGDTQRDQVA